MIRMIGQILVGLMLFFGVATLLPKACFEMKAGRLGQAIKYGILGLLALFFSLTAFFYAYIFLKGTG